MSDQVYGGSVSKSALQDGGAYTPDTQGQTAHVQPLPQKSTDEYIEKK